MAHTKSGGKTKTNRDSISKRLGIKRFGGQKVQPGEIILRQKGNRFYPGKGTKIGHDFTIYAASAGNVKFKQRYARKFVIVEN